MNISLKLLLLAGLVGIIHEILFVLVFYSITNYLHIPTVNLATVKMKKIPFLKNSESQAIHPLVCNNLNLPCSKSHTSPQIPICNQMSYTFSLPNFPINLRIHISQIHQLTSPLISKMSSAGTVETTRPPKVGYFIIQTDSWK